jgi:hypothetical protein|nr:cytochrome c3 family protein [Candidatus Krumholzibacteria bacterium]
MRTSIIRICLLTFVLMGAGLALAAEAPGSEGVIEKEHARRHFNNRSSISELECIQCHSCDLPTAEDPCLVACPRHMGHFHSDQRPDDGPAVVVIDDLANLYDPVVFSHELHATMSDMVGGCENCHHYSEPGGAIPPCRECHDAEKGPVDLNKPSLKGAFHRQCMNCHLDWSHSNACGFCHEEHHDEIADPPLDTTDIVGVKHPLIEATDSYFYDTTYEKGPVVTFHHTDHVDQFGLNCVDCHRGDSCSSCHDQVRSTNTHVESMASCTECHAERGCKFCHDYERKPEFEHGLSTGWELGPRHSKLACQQCHGVPKVFHTPKTQCISCHTDWEDGDFDHARVTGVAFNEDHEGMDCADCHMDSDFSVKPDCSGCHDDDRVYSKKTGFGG